mmetsp:Transcript_7219/g.19779  ORF Transcript_7219/g.19779 Transcript_7219/m.19779 type:complete len:206 (+) Transcript_7219:685-1302(+)
MGGRGLERNGRGVPLAAAGAVAGGDIRPFCGRVLHKSDGIDAHAAARRVSGVVFRAGDPWVWSHVRSHVRSTVVARRGGNVVAGRSVQRIVLGIRRADTWQAAPRGRVADGDGGVPGKCDCGGGGGGLCGGGDDAVRCRQDAHAAVPRGGWRGDDVRGPGGAGAGKGTAMPVQGLDRPELERGHRLQLCIEQLRGAQASRVLDIV